jgi:hypothetical protein
MRASTGPASVGLDPCHNILVAGADEWSVLAAVAGAFGGAPARLMSLSGARFGEGGCTLELRVEGIDPARAQAIADAIAAHPDVRLSRIEHIVWKARP